jgi:hypothetical protein
MNPTPHNRRTLAIVLRSRRFGFAVFEGPTRLLNWGMVFYPLNDVAQHVAASKRVVSLLLLFTPSVVVVGRARLLKVHARSGVNPILRSIRHEASARLIPVRLMMTAEMRRVFGVLHTKSKHEIASRLVKVFPELHGKLPPKRRLWDSEHPIMTMFDAVAMGYAYWQLYGERDRTAE